MILLQNSISPNLISRFYGSFQILQLQLVLLSPSCSAVFATSWQNPPIFIFTLWFYGFLGQAACVAICYLTPFWVIQLLSHFCFVGLTSWINFIWEMYVFNHGQIVTQGHFFKWSIFGLNLDFSFRTDCLIRTKESVGL